MTSFSNSVTTSQNIDAVVASSLKTSINRFRERPLLFFTEADIQTYLHKDLISRNTQHMTLDEGRISLIHREYPTNFRYEKSRLLEGYSDKDLIETDLTNQSIKSRGHFDLVVLNPKFLAKMTKKYGVINEMIAEIINKNVNRAIGRFKEPNSEHDKEILYAIEIKYLHMFNCNSASMLDQIQMDNEKLSIALRRTDSFIKPINIVFSSSNSPNNVKSYMTHGELVRRSTEKVYRIKSGILNIYVEAYHDDENKKYTNKKDGGLIAYCKDPQPWAITLCEKLMIKLNS